MRQLNKKVYTCTYMYVHINLPCEHTLQEKFKHEASRNNIIAKATANVFSVYFFCIYIYYFFFTLDSEGGRGRTLGDRL